MSTSFSKNGVTTADLENAIEAFTKAPTEENRQQVVDLHARLDDYKEECSLCIIARQNLLNGLDQIANGEIVEGVHKISGSVRTAAIKVQVGWSKLLTRLPGIGPSK